MKMAWNAQDFFVKTKIKTKTFYLKTKTKTETLGFETKTKTCVFVLETPRDQDLRLEDYITVKICILPLRSLYFTDYQHFTQ